MKNDRTERERTWETMQEKGRKYRVEREKVEYGRQTDSQTDRQRQREGQRETRKVRKKRKKEAAEIRQDGPKQTSGGSLWNYLS